LDAQSGYGERNHRSSEIAGDRWLDPRESLFRDKAPRPPTPLCAADYRAFESSVIADYNARTAVERELVLRLASLLWRIRRATAIETDLLQIQAEIVRERRSTIETASEAEQKLYGIVDRALRPAMGLDTCEPGHSVDDHEKEQINNDPLQVASRGSTTNSRQLTSCFLRLANLDNGVFERLTRYETALWRQIAQTLLLLRTVQYR
jgi:hypothetical protein